MESNYTSPKVAINERKLGLETPMVVNEILEGCLYSGFFGRLDSARIKKVTDHILSYLDLHSIYYVIIDLSNIDIIDSAVADHLLKVGAIIKLMGIRIIFCGIKPIVAQTMTATGIQFEKYIMSRNLKTAVMKVLDMQNLEIVPKR